MRISKSVGKKIAATLMTAGIAFLMTSPALAALSDTSGLTATGSSAGFRGSDTNLSTIIGRFIGALISLLGMVFVVLLVYGGFTWMTAQGSEEKIKKAKGIVSSAVIGLVVVFASYAIAQAVIGALATSISSTPTAPPAGP